MGRTRRRTGRVALGRSAALARAPRIQGSPRFGGPNRFVRGLLRLSGDGDSSARRLAAPPHSCFQARWGALCLLWRRPLDTMLSRSDSCMPPNPKQVGLACAHGCILSLASQWVVLGPGFLGGSFRLSIRRSCYPDSHYCRAPSPEQHGALRLVAPRVLADGMGMPAHRLERGQPSASGCENRHDSMADVVVCQSSLLGPSFMSVCLCALGQFGSRRWPSPSSTSASSSCRLAMLRQDAAWGIGISIVTGLPSWSALVRPAQAGHRGQPSSLCMRRVRL